MLHLDRGRENREQRHLSIQNHSEDWREKEKAKLSDEVQLDVSLHVILGPACAVLIESLRAHGQDYIFKLATYLCGIFSTTPRLS